MTCGQCKFGEAIVDNLLQVTCKGLPPQMILCPTPQGLQMQLMYPQLQRKTPACALFQDKVPFQ